MNKKKCVCCGKEFGWQEWGKYIWKTANICFSCHLDLIKKKEICYACRLPQNRPIGQIKYNQPPDADRVKVGSGS